jgi:hypothetical protein
MTTINDISSVTLSNTEKSNTEKSNTEKSNTERNSTNKFTLEYLTNPLYKKDDLKKNTKTNDFVLNKEQCSFYRKRIISITKDMLKGEYPSQLLEKIHKEYIQSLINHFKRVDEIEIIQKEYSDLNLKDVSASGAVAYAFEAVDKSIIDKSIIDLSNIQLNNEIMMKRNKPVSIDNFITKKVIKIKKDIPIPQKKILNVNTPAHKIKGIPPKLHKDKV